MKTTASARLLQHTQRRFLCGRVAQRANPAPFVDYISAKTSINFLHNRHLIQSNIIPCNKLDLTMSKLFYNHLGTMRHSSFSTRMICPRAVISGHGGITAFDSYDVRVPNGMKQIRSRKLLPAHRSFYSPPPSPLMRRST